MRYAQDDGEDVAGVDNVTRWPHIPKRKSTVLICDFVFVHVQYVYTAMPDTLSNVSVSGLERLRWIIL